MRTLQTHLPVFGLVLLATCLGVVALPSAARAGCGCDHPPPAYADVMPPFASPGTEITIFAVDGKKFRSGRTYKVDFGGAEVVKTVARSSRHLQVVVPEKAGEDPGPKALKVQGRKYDHEYGEELFTSLPPAPVVPPSGGWFAEWKFFTAVTSEGTLLLPIDAGQVLDAAQFTLHVTNFPLAFGSGDVVIHNADGVDLTLFTLEVDSPHERQWGEYYGWRVEDDTGLYGDYYDPRVLSIVEPEKTSDLLTYWRHEFLSYANAHAPGGSHEIDANGSHPDGSAHIDHGRLVIAISGLERNPSDATDVKRLSPGKMEIDLVLTVTPAPGPLGADEVRNTVVQAVEASVYERERNEVERTLVRVR